MKLSVELRGKIDGLLKRGREKGFVTYDEISQIFTDDIVWSPYLEELFSKLDEERIGIIEEEKEKKTKSLDSVTLYLRDISKIPLLSSEKERELAKEIEECKIAFSEIARKVSIPLRKLKSFFNNDNVDKELKREFKKIDYKLYTARRIIIESNLRLVVIIAKRYVTYSSMPLLDLISEGNIGLIRAIDKFDYKEGYRFSTYASWWIRQGIISAIANESKIIRIPQYLFNTINRSMKVKEELEEELGRSPKMKEIAQKMGLALNRLIGIMNVASEPISLEAPVSNEEQSDLMFEIIEDKKIPSPSDIVFLQILQDQISSVLDILPEREKEIISLRFGLFGNFPHTLDEVGKRFNLTKEAVRQIEEKVLLKLRKRKVVKQIRDDFIYG
ncbi:MAG: sigma-70 family RNA polymerase sigma factor [bacterium]